MTPMWMRSILEQYGRRDRRTEYTLRTQYFDRCSLPRELALQWLAAKIPGGEPVTRDASGKPLGQLSEATTSKSKRGPAPGSGPYVEADRALYPELERLMPRKTLTAAAEQLEDEGKIQGPCGEAGSRATRLRKRYVKDHQK
jgi:hypothetical protein